MSSTIIDITCKQCSHINTRSYGWLDPNKFSNPQDASLLSTFYCVKCHSGNTLKLKFLPSEKLEISEILEFESKSVEVSEEEILIDKQEKDSVISVDEI